jgi:3'-phosphoadenosine 5'-phosphosulfate sulfotransferase (PAPS reductase)/FAD synthetase
MIRAISYGGGVQSTAMLVLAARRVIDYPLAIFCNVGEDSENPDTIAYVTETARPFAADHGIDLVERRYIMRDGTEDTILRRLYRQERTVHIPMRMAHNGAPGNRSCTFDFKINLVHKELRARGATSESPATVALGISLDEFSRMRPSKVPVQISAFPLIDLRMTRDDCVQVIRDAGLPVPPKSSCWFCPFSKKAHWESMRDANPGRFLHAVAIEQMVIAKRAAMGKDPMYFTATRRPLAEMTDAPDDGATCDIGGYCHA